MNVNNPKNDNSLKQDVEPAEKTALPADADPVKRRKSLWRMLLIYGSVLLVMAGVMVWASLFRSVPLKISKQTTYITEPLTEDGKRVDYFKAIEQEYYKPEMTTDENGYRLIVRAIGSGV